jgi:hypothetical protein
MKKEQALNEAPVNNDLCDLFSERDYMTAIYAMTQTNIAVVANNQESTRIKAETLQHGSNTF